LETQILGVALEALLHGEASEVHGFALAKQVADQDGSRRLTSHGTLYKALARLEGAGLLSSRWEDHRAAEEGGRPRRRLYQITSSGQVALAEQLARHAPSASDPTAALGRGAQPA
jgi:PadR family transcriptional regulator, regulatory protein PadR